MYLKKLSGDNMKEKGYELNIRKVYLTQPIWTGFCLTLGAIGALILFFSIFKVFIFGELFIP